MKVLITDPIHEAGVKMLEEVAGVEVATDLSKEDLLEKIRDADALLVRSKTKVTKEVIDSGKKLKVVGRAGVGVDNIDLNAATQRGIVVVNAPEASTITVAEHTMAMMLSLARNIPFADGSLKAKVWDKKRFMGMELRGKTLGIIGLGRIGSQVATRAKAFGMQIVGYDPYISEKTVKSIGAELVNLSQLLRRADFITLHVPLTDKTRGIIGKKEIGKMKDGVFLINCARGGIVDEDALYEGLKSGKIAGAGIDVFKKEPPFDSPLLKLNNVIVTPHLGASTEEAQRNASTIAAGEVIKVLKNEAPKNVVNMPVFAPEVLEVLGGYIPLAESLGIISTQLVEGRTRDIAITYCGELHQIEDIDVLTNAVLKGLLFPLLSEGVNLLNAPIVAKNRGIRVTEAKREDAEGYGNLIILNMQTEVEEREVHGTLLGGEEARIVGIDGYKVDLTPKGKILLVKHEDKPGMIGKVATSLGNYGVNIASMQVGRKSPGELQLMVLTVDQKISKEVLEVINKIDGVNRVKMAEL